MRIGFGYDVHRFTANRPLVLGGLTVPFTHGLRGHSDADVLLHAIIDALLGAASLGDIGLHFPPDDPAYKGILSLTLLARTAEALNEKGYALSNLDSTIVCEAPKLIDHIPAMRANITRTLACAEDQINIKATTEEGLGFTGNGEGMAAYAVALIEKSTRP
ncbi:MAG: 2-C-methyl-D-erythritol 2,4-cyclodiphosphate synthase [Thermodesulfobacteriota bacterium]